MDEILQDVRYCFRMLIKNPGFTIVALLTLGLGIGANTAIFSVVNGLLLRPLPYGNPERIVVVWQDFSAKNGREIEWTSPNTFFAWRDQNRVFDQISVIDAWLPTITAGEPEQLPGATVTHNIFSVLGVSPSIGRSFVPEEDKPNGPKVVILSDRLWKKNYASDPAIAGKDILINQQKYTVVGVMPSNFEFPLEPMAQIWTPMQIDSANSCGDCITLRSIARLKDGVSAAQAASSMNLLTRNLERDFPDIYRGVKVTLVPLQQQLTEEIRPAILLLLAAVGLVLLIACANVANLLLVRASNRKAEIAIRSALGAGKARIMRQLITENLMLAFAGGAAGIFIGFFGIDLLINMLPDDLPIIGLNNIVIDSQVLLFTLAISLVSGIVFGLVPLFQFSDSRLNDSLKEGGRTRSGASGNKVRSIFVVAEVALALMLLIGAGLMIKSFIHLINVNPGFQPDNVLTMQVNLPDSRYPERELISSFYSQLLEKAKSLPRVKSAGTTSALPFGGSNTDTNFLIEGQTPHSGLQNQIVWYQQVSSEYLQTLGITLLKGRYFSEQDDPSAPRVVIVTDTFARKYFPKGDVLGKRLNFNDPQKPVWREIVGVVSDVKQFGLNQDSPIALYFHQKQSPSPFATVAVRTSGNPLDLAGEMRSLVWSLDKHLAVSGVQTMEQVIGNTISVPRITLLLTGVFAAAAMLLAALGLYGVVSYSAAQRTNEIGIRMALGAGRQDVLKMVVGQGLVLTLIGVVIGLCGAFAFTRLINSLLFGVSATDPLTFLVVSITLVIIAALASYIPAHRASKIDPVIALRYE